MNLRRYAGNPREAGGSGRIPECYKHAVDIIVVLLALAAAVFFGLALVLTQAGLRYLGPFQGACISISSAAAGFVLLSPFSIGFGDWDARSAGLFALIGCLFPATVTILTFSANRRIGPNLTAALGNLAPMFAVVMAIVLLGEAPETAKIAALIIIVAGVLMLYRTPSLEGIAWAFALPIAAAFIRGMVQPMVKIGLAGWSNPFAAVTIGYLVSMLVVLASGAVRERGWPVAFNRNGWLWFTAVGACNGLAVFSMYQALSHGAVTIVAPLVACYPLATLAFGWAFLGSGSITRQTAIGVGITVAGVALLLAA